jgi:hypothetical protein
VLVEVDVPVSLLLLVADVPLAVPEPETEPEIEPDALTLALLVSAGAVVEVAADCDALASRLVLLALVLVPAGVLSMLDVLVFVSTEQPVRPATTPRTLTKVTYLFFIRFSSEVLLTGLGRSGTPGARHA